jgi:hypothetical protein
VAVTEKHERGRWNSCVGKKSVANLLLKGKKEAESQEGGQGELEAFTASSPFQNISTTHSAFFSYPSIRAYIFYISYQS